MFHSGLGILKIRKVAVTGPISDTNNCGSTVNPAGRGERARSRAGKSFLRKLRSDLLVKDRDDHVLELAAGSVAGFKVRGVGSRSIPECHQRKQSCSLLRRRCPTVGLGIDSACASNATQISVEEVLVLFKSFLGGRVQPSGSRKNNCPFTVLTHTFSA